VPYVRFALMQPRPGQAQKLRALHTELLRYDRTLPGFLGGYLLEPADGTGRIGRLVLWENRADADHAAQQQHTLTLRSALPPLIVSDASGHLELATEATRV
jgi:heme-degrading monooxygenase HmoA